jgi:PAS domain S-box-containing protein
MPKGIRRHLAEYGAAVLAVGLALAVKVGIAHEWAVEAPFLLFLGAVVFASWYGGVGPGLAATVFATLAADFFFIDPDHEFRPPPPDQALRLVQFFLEGVFISVFSGLRKQSGDQAHRRAEELRVTLRSIGDAVIAADRHGRITFLNPVAERLTGWAAAEAVGRPIADVLHLAHQQTGKRVADGPCERVLRTGEPTGLGSQTALVSRDGTARPVDDSADPIRDPDGRLLGVVMVFRDVTVRRAAEGERRRLLAQLEAEQARLKAVLEQMPAGVLVAEAPGGRVVLSNQQANDLLGGLADRLRSREDYNDWVAHHPDGTPVAAAGLALLRALDGEAVRAAEFRYPGPPGRDLWLRENAAPVRDRDGAVTSAVLVLDDVTREKEAEHALRRSHDQLLSRVATTSEEERRRLSRELHDETSQQLAALILGLRSLRDRTGPDGPAAAALGGLQEQAEQVGEVLHRIAYDLRPAVLDELGLETALRDAVERWSRRAGIPAEFFGTLGPTRLPADVETHVYRMVNEALTNVLKHAQADRISVIVERPGGGLTVIVEDNGRGFDVDAVLKDARGSQLGLRGMQERAALIGGTVELETSDGDGTTVYIRVPHAPAAGGKP